MKRLAFLIGLTMAVFQVSGNSQPYLAVTGGVEKSQETAPIPSLEAFIQECLNESGDVSCLYSEDLLATHLYRGNYKEVPKKGALLLDFAWEFEVVGIAAHNNAEGKKFFELKEGQILTLIKGNGDFQNYVVAEIQKWRGTLQADRQFHVLAPWDGGDLVQEIDVSIKNYVDYGGNYNKLVLQTCIGNIKGLLFVSAYKQNP